MLPRVVKLTMSAGESHRQATSEPDSGSTRAVILDPGTEWTGEAIGDMAMEKRRQRDSGGDE